MNGRPRKRRNLLHRVVLLPSTPGAAYEAAEQLGEAAFHRRLALALVGTLLFHAALTGSAIWGDLAHDTRPQPAVRTTAVTLERIPPAPEEPKAPAPPSPTPPVRRAPPPAAARSGRVVTAPEDPNKPLDLTQFDMPVGKSESYAGGFTAPSGTSEVAVNDPRAHARGVVGGTGTTPGGSLARPAAPARRDWSCPWPEEEQSSDLREARVTVRVQVDRDGSAQTVEVLNSPTPAFAVAARVCARSERFAAAHDDAGRPIAATIPSLSIHFVR
jgi:outer membrane biosynthesis protein TonB